MIGEEKIGFVIPSFGLTVLIGVLFWQGYYTRRRAAELGQEIREQ